MSGRIAKRVHGAILDVSDEAPDRLRRMNHAKGLRARAPTIRDLEAIMFG
jgi:hypothetical protein